MPRRPRHTEKLKRGFVMRMREITATPAQLMVEQLAASGVRYVFNNSGSREAPFFDALHEHRDVHGILALHEGSVTAMASGYTQVKLDPAVSVVHLGAGLAQSLGQLINTWAGSLPVVMITFVGDTGSYSDRIGLDLSHDFGPTSISAPFTKASWAVIEPEHLPHAVERALRVAKTPPVGPVHLAVYDRLLNSGPVTARIADGPIPESRAGHPDGRDVEELTRALHDATRPLIYAGDGVWKSGAIAQLTALAEHFGVPITGYQPSVPFAHPLHCGAPQQAAAAVDPDFMIAIGVRHTGGGGVNDFAPFATVDRIMAIGPDVRNLKGIPGIDLAILADERRTLESIALLGPDTVRFADRRTWAQEVAASLRSARRAASRGGASQPSRVRAWRLGEALDYALERAGGGLVMIEQFAIPIDTVGDTDGPARNRYLHAAGGSEGYGVGAPVGVKLAAPDRPVVGLVGDGSLYYADSGMWTAAHHGVPVLYVVPNNGAYGIVANSFQRGAKTMSETGEYAGVVLGGIDPVKIAEGFGVEGMHVEDESRLEEAIAHGLGVTESEARPFLLNVRLPLGLPEGGREAPPYRLAAAKANDQAA